MQSVDTTLLTDVQSANLNFDEDGFLIDPECWNRQTAQQIADLNGIQNLALHHFQIVHFIRDYYFELGSFAAPHRICSELDIEKDDMKQFFGSCLNVWKIAGLPNPGEEAKAYMS
mgnify:CR=1 FL=1